MSRIDKDTVRHVALLGRLELNEEKIESFTKELDAILSYVEKLNELDVSNVPPTSHSLKLENVFREDVAKPSLKPEEAVANAPAQEMNLFRVPPILQEG